MNRTKQLNPIIESRINSNKKINASNKKSIAIYNIHENIVTFKDLKKRVTIETQQTSRLFEKLRNKAFWIWDIKQHKQEDIRTKGECCFNHSIGLPTKERIEKPIFDYQKILYDTLLIPSINNSVGHNFKHKHLWVKKATGLGVTEFFLRLMAWHCLKDVEFSLRLTSSSFHRYYASSAFTLFTKSSISTGFLMRQSVFNDGNVSLNPI